MIRIRLQYIDGCPHWETADQILSELLAEGWDATVERELIESNDHALERGFHGSPTVLVDGDDPFADEEAPPALACRLYQTETGPSGSPSIGQLREAMARAEKGLSHGYRR